MEKVISFIALLLVQTVLVAQSLPLTTLANLPANFNENSGLESEGLNRIWLINDGGNTNELFEVDSNGVIQRTLFIANASNSDWEDLTKDDKGYFYIGDFGNNLNQRQNLRIYKVIHPDSSVSDTLIPEIISFSYSDQLAFPPIASRMNFDMEAFFWYQDSLYLFSKNRTNPYDGWIKMYQLSADSGTHVAQLVDSFQTGGTSGLTDWITAADISPDANQIALLSHAQIWLFSCFDGNDFFGGENRLLTLPSFSQKEGICYGRNDRLFVSDELLVPLPGRNLYKSELTSYAEFPNLDLGPDTTHFGDSIQLNSNQVFATYSWSNGGQDETTTVYQSGTYWLDIEMANGCKASDTIVVNLIAGIAEESQFELKVFPNPSKDFIRIEAEIRMRKVEVYNELGQLIFTEKVWGKHIDFELKEKGIFTVKIELETGERMLRKIVITD